jgi:hypothetical protein
MIYFEKSVLIEDFYLVPTEEFSITAIPAIRTLDERPGIYIRDKPIFSSERMSHKAYEREGISRNFCGRESQGASHQEN